MLDVIELRSNISDHPRQHEHMYAEGGLWMVGIYVPIQVVQEIYPVVGKWGL